jgi:hypothetical protein
MIGWNSLRGGFRKEEKGGVGEGAKKFQRGFIDFMFPIGKFKLEVYCSISALRDVARSGVGRKTSF